MSQSKLMSAEAQELLGQRLQDAQNLEAPKASALASKVLGADADIAEAALTWARSGIMPEEPKIGHETPRSLAARFAPSQVFTGMMLLRSDPQSAERIIRRGVDLRITGAASRVPGVRTAHQPVRQKPVWRPPRERVLTKAYAAVPAVAFLVALAVLSVTGAVSASVAVGALASIIAVVVAYSATL